MVWLVEVFVDEIAWDCDTEHYDEDSKEWKANFPGVEAVDLTKDDWECFKPNVEHAINERGVCVED